MNDARCAFDSEFEEEAEEKKMSVASSGSGIADLFGSDNEESDNVPAASSPAKKGSAAPRRANTGPAATWRAIGNGAFFHKHAAEIISKAGDPVVVKLRGLAETQRIFGTLKCVIPSATRVRVDTDPSADKATLPKAVDIRRSVGSGSGASKSRVSSTFAVCNASGEELYFTADGARNYNRPTEGATPVLVDAVTSTTGVVVFMDHRGAKVVAELEHGKEKLDRFMDQRMPASLNRDPIRGPFVTLVPEQFYRAWLSAGTKAKKADPDADEPVDVPSRSPSPRPPKKQRSPSPPSSPSSSVEEREKKPKKHRRHEDSSSRRRHSANGEKHEKRRRDTVHRVIGEIVGVAPAAAPAPAPAPVPADAEVGRMLRTLVGSVSDMRADMAKIGKAVDEIVKGVSAEVAKIHAEQRAEFARLAKNMDKLAQKIEEMDGADSESDDFIDDGAESDGSQSVNSSSSSSGARPTKRHRAL